MKSPHGSPPLELHPEEARDWGVSCDECEEEIPPDTAVRIQDRTGLRYCTRCAVQAHPDAAFIASRVENFWQSILAVGDAHFNDLATILRALADTADRLARADLHLHHDLTEVEHDQWCTWCTARPPGWEPPWRGWPFAEVIQDE